MPDEFNLPLAAELWAPLALTPAEASERGTQPLLVIGKLRRGVSSKQADAEIGAIARDLQQRYPRTNEERGALVTSFRESMKTNSDAFILVLAGAALFVLLLACTNVGSLQVARTMARQREFGLRGALGASVSRILRQLLTESLVLGLVAGGLGLALANWDLQFTRTTIPVMVYRFVPGLRAMRINGDAVILGIVLAIVVSVLCSIPAVLQVIRQQNWADSNEVLKEGGRSGSSPSRSRIRSVLVIAEVALAFVLPTGAGLMVSTFRQMLSVNLGYDPNNVLMGEISLYGSEYSKPDRVASLYTSTLAGIAELPDVDAVAAFGSSSGPSALYIEGRPQPRPGEPEPEIRAATPGYWRALRIPLREGRWISEQDSPDAPRVVVVSEFVARHYWPGASPIGQRIRLGNSGSNWLTVAGVVGDRNDWFLGRPLPAAYVSYRQFPRPAMQVFVRTSHDPENLAAAPRLAVNEVDREQPVYNVHTLQQQMYEETSGVRNAARMMITYAVIALLLAITGIYSVTSFFAVQRTREIGSSGGTIERCCESG